MDYHEKVNSIVAAALKLADLAQAVRIAASKFDAAQEALLAEARAIHYPIRELQAIMPKVKVKIETSAPAEPVQAADLGAM